MPSQTLVSDSEKALVLDSDSAPAFETPSESNNRSGDGETGSGARKGKSRLSDGEAKQMIQVMDIMEDFTGGIDFDPELRALNSRDVEISRLLYCGLPLDDIPEGARSPSPEPVYDNLGIRINTRRYRARERLMRESQEIAAQIIKKTISKPPADYRPPKLQKKLYIPLTQYPGFNFIGHIIGPRGSIQKRMEKETGAKIVIRGDGRLQHKRDSKPDPSENDDLHVLIEAETQEALDAATVMVEKLLQPVDEVVNEHKRQRLREFAALNMTVGNEEYVLPCGMLPG